MSQLVRELQYNQNMNFYFQHCLYRVKLFKDRSDLFFLRKGDTGLSVYVYLSMLMVKWTGLLGCSVINALKYFNVLYILAGTNGLYSLCAQCFEFGSLFDGFWFRVRICNTDPGPNPSSLQKTKKNVEWAQNNILSYNIQ